MASRELTASELEERIWETFEGGGNYAHNIIQLDLRALSKIDKTLADRIYAELQDQGY